MQAVQRVMKKSDSLTYIKKSASALQKSKARSLQFPQWEDLFIRILWGIKLSKSRFFYL